MVWLKAKIDKVWFGSVQWNQMAKRFGSEPNQTLKTEPNRQERFFKITYNATLLNHLSVFFVSVCLFFFLPASFCLYFVHLSVCLSVCQFVYLSVSLFFFMPTPNLLKKGSYRYTDRHAERQTSQQTYRWQTGRQADRQTGRQAGRQTDIQTDRRPDRLIDRLTDRQPDGQIDIKLYRQPDR